MLEMQHIEDLICAVAVLDRDALVQQFQAYPSTFPIDFTGEFLQTVKTDSAGEPARAFQLLLDQECTACGQLGIRDDLAKPSTYILDTHGNVVYAYVGATSTDRPSIRAILAQLDRIP